MKPPSNQPKPLKTYKNRHGTMKNQSGTIKTNLGTGWLWVVQVVTGDSKEEVMIFRDKHTLHHNIYIIIIVIFRATVRCHRLPDLEDLLIGHLLPQPID